MPILTPFYGPGSHKFCGNISHPYPDNFLNASAFLESAHSTAQWTNFCLTGWIWGLFGDGHLRRESAPNFCPRTTKLGGIIWVTQKSILMDQYTGSHKEIWINCQFWVLPKSLKNGLQTNLKHLFWYKVTLKRKPPSILNLEIPQKSMKTIFEVI